MLIKAKENMELKQGEGIDPPRAGETAAAKVESEDEWLTSDDEAAAAAAKAKKQKKKGKKGKSGSKNKGQKAGGKKGKAGAADGSDKETRTCHHCKKVGHLERNCWTKHPELKPGAGSGAAVTGTAPEEPGPDPGMPLEGVLPFFTHY